VVRERSFMRQGKVDKERRKEGKKERKKETPSPNKNKISGIYKIVTGR
jgi:hypothetical protein